MRIADDVLENKVLIAVFENAFQGTVGGLLEGGIDLFFRRLPLEYRRKIGDRTIRRRHTKRVTAQLAVQLGNDLPHRLGGPGGRRYDVDRSRTGPALVLVRKVEDTLVVRVRMDRVH